MYTVALVDDEPWALLGIRNSIDWPANGFEIVAETTDPERALSIIREHAPDLVITDIRMPEISGIELIRESRRAGITSEFVIVSGYAEFEWAQAACEFDVAHYLLKPIDVGELEELVAKIIKRLEQKKRAREQLSVRHLVVSGRFDGKALHALFEKKGFNPRSRYYQAIAVQGVVKNVSLPCVLPVLRNFVTIELAEDMNVVLADTDADLYEDLLRIHGESRERASLRIGVSSLCVEVEEIALRVREADIALQGDFRSHGGGVHRYRPPDSLLVKTLTGRILEDPAVTKPERLSVLLAAHALSMEETALLYNSIVSAASARVEYAEPHMEKEIVAYDEVNRRFSTVEEFSLELGRLIQGGKGHDSLSAPLARVNESFSKLVRYVEEHYRERLSLEDLSKTFHLSPTYICDLFKKVIGSTLTGHVTNLRLTRARDLLARTRDPVHQVAESVGYEDCFYFDKLFKRRFGSTPTEYRKQTAP